MSDLNTRSLHIVFGVNEAPLLLEGWYGRERFHGGITARMTGRSARLAVDLQGAEELAITYVAHTLTVGRPIHGALLIGEMLLGRLNVTNNAWKTSRWHVPDGMPKAPLTIETHNPWCPNDYFHNGDGRIVGLVVSAIRVTYL